MKKLLTITIFLLSGFLVIGQPYTKVQDVDLIEKHGVLILREYPEFYDKIVVQDVFIINDKHSKVTYLRENEPYEAIINYARKDMLLIATYKQLNKTEVPNIVLDEIKEGRYEDWDQEAYYQVTTPTSSEFYAVELSSGSKIQRVHFDDTGRFKTSPY